MSGPVPQGLARVALWRHARRVLAVRLDNMGDVLMTSPAFAAIRDSLPGVHLSLLCSPSGAALKPHLPMIDQVIASPVPWMKAASDADEGTEFGRSEVLLVERLSRLAFDAAIIFTTCTQSALPAAMLCRMAGIPLRLAHCRENPYRLLSDWAPERDVLGDGMRHEVQRQLDLVASVGLKPRSDRMVFAIDEHDARRVHSRLMAVGIDTNKPYLVVHPGATAPSRRYPAARFGAAADTIAHGSRCNVLFTGDASEEALIAEARAGMRRASHSLAGQLQLGELGALIAGAQLLVSNNTGPAHIAAAVGTPVVDLYALTNPQHTPWRVASRVLNHDVPCRNCLKSVCPQGHHDCLMRVPAQAVADAAFELMADRLIAAAPTPAPMNPATEET